MSCEHDCETTPIFPLVADNRPGLERVRTRIGDYARMRQHLLARLDQERRLQSFTHRAADDPGIALLEGAALVGDVLTYYQELYANEARLRTAHWEESVSRLVALTGYRLSPGASGRATFAVVVGGDAPVQVPKGFAFKAQLTGATEESTFESLGEVSAAPALSRFHLYRPRRGPQPIVAGTDTLELVSVGGRAGLAERMAAGLRSGDRLMLLPDASVFERSGSYVVQARAELVVVAEVVTELDRVRIRFEGPLRVARGGSVRAVKLGRTFRHFGHAAPTRIGVLNESTGIMNFIQTSYSRSLRGATSPARAGSYSRIAAKSVPLDADVADLSSGKQIVCEGAITVNGSVGQPFCVVRSIEAVSADAPLWAELASPVSVLELDRDLVQNPLLDSPRGDVRNLRFHEVDGPELEFGAPSAWQDGPFGDDTTLVFVGRRSEARELAKRSLLLAGEDQRVQRVNVMSEAADFDSPARDEHNPWPWPIVLDQAPVFPREAFDETAPSVVVYGNLVDANEGETQRDAVVGSGDASQKFQTFALPKHPLSHALRATQSPSLVPELSVSVAGVLWRRVESFFTAGPQDQVYVVRRDEAGESWIQFGDGESGQRLPSGKNNVVARFRTGVGAHGSLAAGRTPKAKANLPKLTAVELPGQAVEGAQPEDSSSARRAAPLRMQSLGRLVGLADFEAEALSLPGVLSARASWYPTPNGPRLRVVVLTEGGTQAEADAVALSLSAANRCRGSARFPIQVVAGLRQFVALELGVGIDPALGEAEVRGRVLAALGVAKDARAGLFAPTARSFGQGIHVSQVLGGVQQLSGVVWVRVDGLALLDLGTPPQTDPTRIALPATLDRAEAIGCPSDCMLALDETHLRLSLVLERTTTECGT